MLAALRDNWLLAKKHIDNLMAEARGHHGHCLSRETNSNDMNSFTVVLVLAMSALYVPYVILSCLFSGIMDIIKSWF